MKTRSAKILRSLIFTFLAAATSTALADWNAKIAKSGEVALSYDGGAPVICVLSVVDESTGQWRGAPVPPQWDPAEGSDITSTSERTMPAGEIVKTTRTIKADGKKVTISDTWTVGSPFKGAVMGVLRVPGEMLAGTTLEAVDANRAVPELSGDQLLADKKTIGSGGEFRATGLILKGWEGKNLHLDAGDIKPMSAVYYHTEGEKGTLNIRIPYTENQNPESAASAEWSLTAEDK